MNSKFAPPTESLGNAQKLFEEYLAEKSLRLTSQRRLILDYFLHAEWHQSAEELYHQLRKLEPRIGFSTVYRTLKLLCECNLARELPLGDERSHFEPMYKVQHHDHLVCTGCGKINEFYCQEIEDLQQKICAEQGFALGSHTHEIYGQCSDCQKKSTDKKPYQTSRAVHSVQPAVKGKQNVSTKKHPAKQNRVAHV